MQHDDVRRWVDAYEQAWRTPGTGTLTRLFTDDATYVASPWELAVVGLDSIGGFWESERDGPDERFQMSSEIVAVDGDTAVVRAAVDYATGTRWRDLWVLRFAEDGRCRAFEEWPFAPDQRDGH